VEYEIEIPSYLILESDYLAEGLTLNINTGSCYSEHIGQEPPDNRQVTEFEWNWGLDGTSHTDILWDTTSDITLRTGYEFNTRYYHIVTSQQAASTTDIEIALPETILDNKELIVNGLYGEMSYGDHYSITNNGDTLTIHIDNVDLETGQVLELYVYKNG